MRNKGGFSMRRATGITAAKQNKSRKTGVPMTKSGRQRKVGAAFGGGGCLMLALSLFSIAGLMVFMIASFIL